MNKFEQVQMLIKVILNINTILKTKRSFFVLYYSF